MRDLAAALPAVGKLVADMPAAKAVAAVIGGAIAYCLPDQGARDTATAAVVLILLDTLTGVVAARSSGQAISSARLSRALVKLLGYGSVLIVAAICARMVPGATGLSGASVGAVLGLVVATEALSVLENVHRMGLKVPFGLEKFLSAKADAGGNDEVKARL